MTFPSLYPVLHIYFQILCIYSPDFSEMGYDLYARSLLQQQQVDGLEKEA